jgi:hypothetical protein
MATLNVNSLENANDLTIQRAGSTIITVSATGISVVGTMSATAGTFGTNGTGTRTIQSGGVASGGSNGDIYYIY